MLRRREIRLTPFSVLRLEVVDADGETRIILRIDEHGGKVGVTGKGEGMAAMGINVYGSGAISVYDTNGYLQGR